LTLSSPSPSEVFQVALPLQSSSPSIPSRSESKSPEKPSEQKLLPIPLKSDVKSSLNPELKVFTEVSTLLFSDRSLMELPDSVSSRPSPKTPKPNTTVRNRLLFLIFLGDLTGGEKVGYSLTAGFLGALVGNPADLTLVRFQADGSLPVDQRRNYKNVFEAMGRIIKEEGLPSLWRGSGSTIARAMSMNLGMLAPYEEVKDRLNAFTGTKDSVSTRLT
jgi:hypothetical protein